ncbi:MAG: hypothetical protein AB7F09_01350 [Parvibaculaceae bacterium]
MTLQKLLKLAAFSLVFLAAAMSLAEGEEPRPSLLFSYEVLNFDVHKIDPAKLPFARRAELTQAALQDELPQILAVLDLPGDKIATLMMPGGYKLETNASLQSAFEVDDKTADLFAAALGYTFRQWSVLVTDFAPEGPGDTAYGVITFDHALSGPEADAFFQHAAKINPALGNGFTAFDEEMFFLNVTDGTGKPYSGVDDKTFLADLAKAAQSYAAEKVEMTGTGRADARFIENDWQSSPDGEDYAKRLGEALTRKLKVLRAGHDADLAKAVTKN